MEDKNEGCELPKVNAVAGEVLRPARYELT